MTYAIAVITAGVIGYGLRWLQVAVRPDVPSTGWQLRRKLSRGRAVFAKSCVARNPIVSWWRFP